MADPVPGVPLPDFKAMNPTAILDRDPETWTSGEATLILSLAIMMFGDYAHMVYGVPTAERALLANVAAVAVKAAPKMDPRIIFPWPKVRDLMKKQVVNYAVREEEDRREEDRQEGRTEAQADPTDRL